MSIVKCIEIFAKEYQDITEEIQPKEWVKIAMDLLDLFFSKNKKLKNHAIKAFGYIAKIVGPSDILLILINNLKIQDRSSRISSSVAIAVIA